jgi:hypothetical protein
MRVLALALLLLTAPFVALSVSVTFHDITLTGPQEDVPNASPATARAQIFVNDDPADFTWEINLTYADFTAPTTNIHIHAATTTPGTGAAGVATPAGGLPGFTFGATSGTFQAVYDLTQTSSYSTAWLTAHGNDPIASGNALIAAIRANQAYLNIHSTAFPAGEIRSFLGAGVNGDPQFAGFQGQKYQVHGIPDSVFNLISSPDFVLNSNFVYLASGTCNYNDTQCWTHAGTYLDHIGMLVRGDNETSVHRISAVAGPHDTGLRLYLDDQEVTNSKKLHQTQGGHAQTFKLAKHVTVSLFGKSSFTVSTPTFVFTFTNSDNFFNFAASLLRSDWLKLGAQGAKAAKNPNAPKLHGLLGQTWMKAKYAFNRVYEGEIDEYVVSDVFATDFVYNQFEL